MAKAKKRKIINYRQLKVAEIWERDPSQTQEQIAEILLSEFGIKVNRSTVSRDIKELDRRNLEKSEAITRAVKAQVAREYEFIYGEAIFAWDGKNPSVLGQAQNALKSIRELYGLDAAQKFEYKLEKEIERLLEILQRKLEPGDFKNVLEALTKDIFH